MSEKTKPNTRKIPRVFYIGTFISAIVIALPLIGHQFPNPRPGLFWYPIFFIPLTLLVAWGLTSVSGLASANYFQWETSQIILAIIACFTAGFFSPWLATFGPAVLGDRAWRGDFMSSNLLTVLVGITSGFWAALAIRKLRRPPNISHILFVIIGCIAIQILWVFEEKINDVSEFWTTFADAPPGVATYFLLEAVAAQVAWPLALLTCVYFWLWKSWKVIPIPPDEQIDKGGQESKQANVTEGQIDNDTFIKGLEKLKIGNTVDEMLSLIGNPTKKQKDMNGQDRWIYETAKKGFLSSTIYTHMVVISDNKIIEIIPDSDWKEVKQD